MAEDKPANSNKKTDIDVNKYIPPHQRSWFLPTVVIVALVLILGFFASLWAWGFGHNFRYGPVRYHKGYAVRMPMMRGGYYGGQDVNSNQNRLHGVVTSVSGSSFTMAGNGSTNTVKTNSSTQYQNGNQVKVNDTVLVLGTNSNGTLTADTVVINP